MFSKFRSSEKSPRAKQEEKKTQDSIGSPSNQAQIVLGTGLTCLIDELEEIPQQFMFAEMNDHYRCEIAHESGGFKCSSKEQVEKLRSVGKQMIKLIGKKILIESHKDQFPNQSPQFMNAAVLQKNPLNRFKFTCAAILSSPYYLDMFMKPLNPILGETLQAKLKDGTKVYCQQISHHPPISYFLIYGPKESYQFSGYYDFQVSPGLNSLRLKNIGKRKFVFKNGDVITASYPTGEFSNTFIGTTKIEEMGECLIRDETNDIQLLVEYNKIKKEPSDYFESFITIKGNKVVDVRGTYCGYIDIGSKRYWDSRVHQGYELIWNKKKRLPSDWSHRRDIKCLKKNEMQQGQMQKQRLQQLQRGDAKLRKKFKAE